MHTIKLALCLSLFAFCHCLGFAQCKTHSILSAPVDFGEEGVFFPEHISVPVSLDSLDFTVTINDNLSGEGDESAVCYWVDALNHVDARLLNKGKNQNYLLIDIMAKGYHAHAMWMFLYKNNHPTIRIQHSADSISFSYLHKKKKGIWRELKSFPLSLFDQESIAADNNRIVMYTVHSPKNKSHITSFDY